MRDFEVVGDDGILCGALEHEGGAAEVWHRLKARAFGLHLGAFVDVPNLET